MPDSIDISSDIKFFLQCKRPEAMGLLLGISSKQFNYLMYHRNLNCFYKIFHIPKKNGKIRKIISPNSILKNIQKKLIYFLYQIYEEPSLVTGYIKRKNIVNNAEPHIKQKIILKIDLKDFFTTIDFFRVRNLFVSKPFFFSTQIATLLAKICCYNGYLPQGAPSSPIISNMICYRMDQQLFALISSNNYKITRYADDITISSSSDTFLNYILKSENPIILSNKLRSIIENNNFRINYEKLALRKNIQSMYVTGIKVNTKLNLSRSKYRQIRSMIHSYLKFGDENCLYKYFQLTHRMPNCSFYKIIGSYISFFEMIRGRGDFLSQKLRLRLNDVQSIYISKILPYLNKLNYTYEMKFGKIYIFINIYDEDKKSIGSIWSRRMEKMFNLQEKNSIQPNLPSEFYTNISNLSIPGITFNPNR